MRLFLAIEPSAAARDEAARVQAVLRQVVPDAPVAWDAPAKLHLTLAFLGDDLDPAAVAAAARPVVAGEGPLRLSLGPLGRFGARRPKVIWLGLEGDVARLAALVAALERALVPLGHAPEGRAFHPHLTLGRVRGDRGGRALVEALERAPRPAPCPFEAREVVLVESRLERGRPAVHVARERLGLGPP